MSWSDDDQSGLRPKTLGDRIAASNRTLAGRLTFLLAAVTPGYFLLVVGSSGQSRWVLFVAAAMWFVLIMGMMLFGMARVSRGRIDRRN